MDPKEIETMIARGIPDAQVEVRDYTGGGDHFEALVVSSSFEGKGLIERHQLVYKALGDAMRVQVHALTLKTLTPAQYQNRSSRKNDVCHNRKNRIGSQRKQP